MSKVAIVSPSGKFYGSEQTLYEFLSQTAMQFDVYIKNEDDGLFSKIVGKTGHNLCKFSKPSLLYMQLAFKLLFKYNTIYVNEAGHIRYIKLLAIVFKRKKFIIHVRLTEDTQRARLEGVSSNIKLISVSKYIQQLVKSSISRETEILSSPFRAKDEDAVWSQDLKNKDRLNVGIIGRVTSSKGIEDCISFINYLEENMSTMTLNFYGDVNYEDKNIEELMELKRNLQIVELKFHGFVSDKKFMFSKSDVIIHFNEKEPLGVVFFEALNNKKPFLGFKGGGIGEIAEHLELDNFIKKETGWEKEMLFQLNNLDIQKYDKAYENMLKQYSPKSYTEKLEGVLMDQKNIHYHD